MTNDEQRVEGCLKLAGLHSYFSRLEIINMDTGDNETKELLLKRSTLELSDEKKNRMMIELGRIVKILQIPAFRIID